MEEDWRKMIEDERFDKTSWNHSFEELRARLSHFHERLVVKSVIQLLCKFKFRKIKQN